MNDDERAPSKLLAIEARHGAPNQNCAGTQKKLVVIIARCQQEFLTKKLDHDFLPFIHSLSFIYFIVSQLI